MRIGWLKNSLVDVITDGSVDWVIDGLVDSMMVWLIERQCFSWLNNWWFNRLIDSCGLLINWLFFDGLIDWLIDCMVDSMIDCMDNGWIMVQ